MSAKPHMGLSVGTAHHPMAFCSPSTKYLSSPSFVTTQPMLWPTLRDSKLNSTFLSWPALCTVLADKIQYSGLRYRSNAPEGTSLSSGHSTVKPNLWKNRRQKRLIHTIKSGWACLLLAPPLVAILYDSAGIDTDLYAYTLLRLTIDPAHPPPLSSSFT